MLPCVVFAVAVAPLIPGASSARADVGVSQDKHEWTGAELCPHDAKVDGRTCVLGKDDTASTPAFDDGGGYYRVTWDISWQGCAGDTIPADPTIDDATIGRFAIASDDPDHAAPTTWLHAGLEGSERVVNTTGKDYELAVHLIGDQHDARLTYRHLLAGTESTGCPARVRGVDLEPIDLAAYRASPQRPNFAAIAFPGHDLLRARGVTDEGAQGARIDQAKPNLVSDNHWGVAVQGPGAVELRAGSYRAAFDMRKPQGADSSEHYGVTLAALTSPGTPAPVDQGGTAEGSEGLPRIGNQATLGAAYVRFGDLETDHPATYDVLFEDRSPVERFSLPVSFEQHVGPVAVDSVTVDRLPTLRGYAMQNDDYSGLGFTAQSAGDRMSDACPESYPAEPYYEHDVQRGSSDSWWIRGRQTPVSFPNGASGICTPSLKAAGRAAQWGAAVIFNGGDEGCDSRLDFNLRRSGGPNHGQYLPSGFRGYAFGDATTATNTTVDTVGQAEGTYPNPFGNRLCAPLQIRQVLLLNRLPKLPSLRTR